MVTSSGVHTSRVLSHIYVCTKGILSVSYYERAPRRIRAAAANAEKNKNVPLCSSYAYVLSIDYRTFVRHHAYDINIRTGVVCFVAFGMSCITSSHVRARLGFVGRGDAPRVQRREHHFVVRAGALRGCEFAPARRLRLREPVFRDHDRVLV